MKRFFSKKLLCLCLATLLAVIMSVSAFAEGVSPRLSTTRYFRFQGSAGYSLSVGRSGDPVAQNSNVCIDNYRPDSYRQQWLLETTSNGRFIVLVREGLSSNLALNVNHSTNNCNVYPYPNNSFNDYAVWLNSNGTGMYYVELSSPSTLKLDAMSNSAGGNVYWSTSSTGSSWYLQM